MINDILALNGINIRLRGDDKPQTYTIEPHGRRLASVRLVKDDPKPCPVWMLPKKWRKLAK